MKRTALVLGGGGARGLAHLGVLKALEQENIRIDLIVGCSFGALVGAMYAQNPIARLVEEHMKDFLDTPAFTKLGLGNIRQNSVGSDDYFSQFFKSVKDWIILGIGAKRTSLLKADRLQGAVDFLIEDGGMRDTVIPFVCNASDLITGQPHLFTSGSIRQAVTASMTIPGYFPPVELEEQLLVDGAATYNLPIKFAHQMGAEFIIAVDIHPVLQPENEFKNVMDIILRSKTISANILSEETLYGADILLAPPVKSFNWYEFDRAEELFRAGEEEAYRHIDLIRQSLRKFHRFYA